MVMEWRDTLLDGFKGNFVLEQQAEKSFKVGWDEAIKQVGRTNGLALMEGKRLGAKEVISWIEKNKIEVPTLANIEINYHEWQLKKNSWGIKEGSTETKTTFTFTQEELDKHDEEIREGAYRKAAVSTVNKLSVLERHSIYEALRELGKYTKYLVETYKLK
jgi:hypothetical protein